MKHDSNPCKGCITYAICYSVYIKLSKRWDKTFAIRTMMCDCMYLKEYMTKKLEARLGQTNVMITDISYYYTRSVFLEIPFQLGVRVEFHYHANKQ